MINQEVEQSTSDLRILSTLRAAMSAAMTKFRGDAPDLAGSLPKRKKSGAIASGSSFRDLAILRTQKAVESVRIDHDPVESERLPAEADFVTERDDPDFFRKLRLLDQLLVEVDEGVDASRISALHYLNLEQVFSMMINGRQQTVHLSVYDANSVVAETNDGVSIPVNDSLQIEDNFLVFAPEIFDLLIARAEESEAKIENIKLNELSRQQGLKKQGAWEGKLRFNPDNF